MATKPAPAPKPKPLFTFAPNAVVRKTKQPKK